MRKEEGAREEEPERDVNFGRCHTLGHSRHSRTLTSAPFELKFGTVSFIMA